MTGQSSLRHGCPLGSGHVLDLCDLHGPPLLCGTTTVPHPPYSQVTLNSVWLDRELSDRFLDTVLITLTGQKLLTLDVTTGKAVTGTTSSGQWRIGKKWVNYTLKWGLKPLFLSLFCSLCMLQQREMKALVMQKDINPLKSAGNCGATTFFQLNIFLGWLDVLKTTGLQIDNQILTTSYVFSGCKWAKSLLSSSSSLRDLC